MPRWWFDLRHLASGLEHDIPIRQGRSGNLYGIDTANKILVGEVSGTFNDSDNVSINGSDSGKRQLP